MKIIRTPNFKRRFTDPFKPKRIIAHRLGIKMPRGAGIFRNPKKSFYNKIYNLFTN